MNAVVCHIDYIAQEEEFWRRYRKGERQLFCWTCMRWQFPDQCDHEDRQTRREFDAETRRIAQYVKKNYPSVEARLSKEWRAAARRGELPPPPAERA